MLKSLDFEVFYGLPGVGVESKNVKHGGAGYNSPPETQTDTITSANK